MAYKNTFVCYTVNKNYDNRIRILTELNTILLGVKQNTEDCYTTVVIRKVMKYCLT